MAERITTYTPETAREILRRLDRLEQRQNSLLNGGHNQAFPMGPLVTRWGVTSTTPDYQTYPTSGNVVGVKLGDYEPSPLYPGSTAVKTFTAYDPAVYVYATLESGSMPSEGTHVRLTWRNGKWWVLQTEAAAATKTACFTGHSANKNNDTGVSVPTTYIGPLNSKDLLLVPDAVNDDSTDVSFFSAAAPSAFEDDWLTILEAGVYRFHFQCRVQWPQLSDGPDGNYGTSGNSVTGAAHQHYYPDNTTNFLTETTDPGGIVDVWDQRLKFSMCKMRIAWKDGGVGSPQNDEVASTGCIMAEFPANSNAPDTDLHGIWQRYVLADTTLRVIAYVPDNTIDSPWRVVRQFATLTKLGDTNV